MDKIKKDAIKLNLTNKTIAEKLGVSEGLVSNYFNVKNRISFGNFIELIDVVYGSKKDKLIDEFCQLTTKPENDREALEWCSLNAKFNIVESLINKINNKRGKSDQVLAKLYGLACRRYRFLISPEDFLLGLEEVKIGGNIGSEAAVFINILSMYGHLDFKTIKLVKFYSKLALSGMDNITNDSIRDSFNLRINEFMAINFMKQHEPEEAKEICFNFITEHNKKKYPLIITSLYCLLSELYVFTDFQKSTTYIEEALEMMKQDEMKAYTKRRRELEATHDFIRITNNKFDNLFLSDPAEKAHFYAKLGTEKSRSEALVVLEEISIKNNKLSLFQIYYKALALQDKELMRKSYEEFIKHGETYYATLPYQEIFK